MDDNPEQQLMRKKTKHCQKTARNLKEEYESRLQMPTETTDDSVNSVKQSPIVDDANKQLMDTEVDMESILLKAQVAFQQNFNTHSALPAIVDRSTIQSDANQKQVANVTINQQVGDNKGQNKAKLNPIASEPQALFTGTLPDDFYLHLMSVIGIQECLLSNRLVCSFWNELVLERCHNQKSLKLFETFNNLMDYGELLLKHEKTQDASLILKSIGDDLLVEGLEIDHEQLIRSLHQENDDEDDDDEEVDDEDDVQKEVLTREKKWEASKVLTIIFPKIEQLVLCPEDNTCINIEHLLQFYAEQLTSLTMTDYGTSSESLGSKLRAFSFPKLKSLNTFLFSPEDDQILSLLPQLESLTIESTKISLETLLRTGTQLRELNIFYIYSVYTAPVAEFSKRQPINSNLLKLSFSYAKYFLQVLEFVTQNLTSLECLKLDFWRLGQNIFPHLHLLSPHLAPLQQLHSLTLEASVSFFLLDDNQLTEIQPLPSVRQLKLLLWNYTSLPPESFDLFSRALFTAFPNAEQALIAFVGNEDDDDDLIDDGLVDTDTLAAFEDFTGKHPNVVKLFRSKKMSKFTNLPNAVSSLLGHRRQVYEEYIEEEELFGVAICKLAAFLVTPEGEVGPNLKSILRPANRLTALSNLCQLLESKVFTIAFETVRTMIHHMAECALKFGQSEGALFIVTCKCFLSLLDCSVVDTFNSDKETPFLDTEGLDGYSFFERMLNLVEHYKTQQLNDQDLLLQLYKRMIQFLTKFNSFKDDYQFDEFEMFETLLKLADYYKSEQLNVLDNNKELLLQIRNLIDDQLKKFSNERLDAVMSEFIRSENRVYRVEMARALLRCCKSTDNYFK